MLANGRGLYDLTLPPPPARNSHQDRPTLLVAWWCCGCCLFIIMSRVVGRYARALMVFSDDKWMAASAVPLLIRMGLIHAVLILGTNNADTTGMREEDIRKRVLGSKLVLASRVMYASFIWSQKFCITEFYKRLTAHFWDKSYNVGLKVLRWSLLVTFAVVCISIFAECRPGHRLWQVTPDPGPECRIALVPLVSFGSLNVLTDLLLVFFPIPAICRSSMRTRTKFHMIFLFSLSLLPVATTLYRVPSIIRLQGRYSQAYRTLWASLESLAACVCANAVILNSYARDRGPKRMKFRVPSKEEEEMDRRRVRLCTKYWGSDEDLAGDVGVGMDQELLGLAQCNSRSSYPQSPNIAPKSLPYYNNSPSGLPVYNTKTSHDLDIPSPVLSRGPEWGFDGDNPHTAIKRTETHPPKLLPAPGRAHCHRGRVSFYDVGGLLRDEGPREGGGGGEGSGEISRSRSRSGSGSRSVSYGNMKMVPQEDMIFNDVGGLLGGVSRGKTRV